MDHQPPPPARIAVGRHRQNHAELAVKRAHTFRHSYIMHMLYHRQPRKVIQALAGHKDPRSTEVYTRVFALDMAATLAVPFTGDGLMQ